MTPTCYMKWGCVWNLLRIRAALRDIITMGAKVAVYFAGSSKKSPRWHDSHGLIEHKVAVTWSQTAPTRPESLIRIPINPQTLHFKTEN